jgi:hypothetical protein
MEGTMGSIWSQAEININKNKRKDTKTSECVCVCVYVCDIVRKALQKNT